ncbi:MAG: heavy-metal-associated domain-containing protein [Acidobacteriota bacterium]|nr:heavy-metal-associated domain-containing protein [Acidobacteriota bacterium]
MAKETILKVPDIVCGSGADSIKNALGKMDGIEQIKVDVEQKIVAVEHGEQILRENLEAALDDIGFSVA